MKITRKAVFNIGIIYHAKFTFYNIKVKKGVKINTKLSEYATAYTVTNELSTIRTLVNRLKLKDVTDVYIEFLSVLGSVNK